MICVLQAHYCGNVALWNPLRLASQLTVCTAFNPFQSSLPLTHELLCAACLQVVVATGFIAKNPQGQATTLRRNGSDLSATTMGALFQSGLITIWTDVDGVYSAGEQHAPRGCACIGMVMLMGQVPRAGTRSWHPPIEAPVALWGWGCVWDRDGQHRL